jgi:tripartite-type tricarboxylate transporter receptor subunit TctC
MKLLGVGSLRRLPQFPDAPTIAESGLPGFEFNSFFAITAPAGTPKDIVARLNAEVVKATNAPDVRDKLIAQGFIIKASSPQDLARQTREQLERYAKLFKQAGITVD